MTLSPGQLRKNVRKNVAPTHRRDFLGALALASLGWGTRAWASGRVDAPETLSVACAGSMGSVMEGPIASAAAAQGLALQLRAEGASGLAQMIVGGAIRPDVFIAVTPGPMQTVLAAGKAAGATPIAATEMVIAYSPRSRFAPLLNSAGRPGAAPWWQVLASPGLRFGRSDPRTDPQGRNIVFVCDLAARYYHRPQLPAGILGALLNPAQIFSEATLEARLQSGQLDAAAAYRFQPAPFHLPFVALPPAINLAAPRPDWATTELRLDGRMYRPEPLVFYAAALAAAPHRAAAIRFAAWLAAGEAQAIFHRSGYGPAGAAAPLTAPPTRHAG